MPAPADDAQLLRWFGPNITINMLRPRPIDIGWIVRYKLLGGRIFVHKEDRAAILDNVTCSRSKPCAMQACNNFRCMADPLSRLSQPHWTI